uniref:Uncharacterized protein n=1 Tax=Aegilops tauschii subsp. strangulata TaxID=200361 RepID=A0A453EWI6_AEGTS
FSPPELCFSPLLRPSRTDLQESNDKFDGEGTSLCPLQLPP